ncbi:unnamed protein product [Diabrotica balteata]|uniref:Uncharacterized protein n=1 Tax=Diabrotica balteata TaxID=107213 RepID=A0A9N9SX54_DIABA|nr:unnamed protein product [Diabrotica balteata]
MGLTMSKQETSAPEADSVISSKLHGRQASIRQSAIKAKAKQPMPDPAELERRFTKVLDKFHPLTFEWLSNKDEVESSPNHANCRPLTPNKKL